MSENYKEKEEIRKLRSDRKSRAERRRMIDLGERGSLSRRRRFRVREGKKKNKVRSKSQEEVKRGIRKSKRKRIGKYMENIKRGVLETLSRKIHVNEKIKEVKGEVE